DAAGRTLTSTVVHLTTGEADKTTSSTYDAAGRQVTQTAPPVDATSAPNVTTTTYDAVGNATVVTVTNAGATPTTVSQTAAVFAQLGHQTSKTEEAGTGDAQTTTYAYDVGGRQTSMVEPGNKTTSVIYDALGRMLQTTHPDNSVETSTYDADGRRATLSNSAGTTTDTYDPLGRTVSERKTDGGGVEQTIVSYAYDANRTLPTRTTSFPS